MKLRNIGKLQREANLYKNVSEVINEKNVVDLNKELEIPLKMLLQRKQLLEQLNIENLDDEAKKKLYADIDKNNAYFETLTENQRSEIEDQFLSAHDSYARSAQWQSLFMAFTATTNLAAYKAVDDFQATLEDLQNRKANIDAAKKRIRDQKAEYTKDYPHINEKNAVEKYSELKKENSGLLDQIDELEEDSEKKKKEAEVLKQEREAAFQKEMDELQLQKNKVNAEYKSKEDELKARKLQIEEEYRKNELAKIDRLTIEGKDVYRAAAVKLRDLTYISLLDTKEFETLMEGERQKTEAYENAKAEVVKNASGAFKEYLEAATKKEEEDIAIIKKAAGFFIVCQNPSGETAKKFLARYPEFGKPELPQANVGRFIKATLKDKENATTEKEKGLIVFAEAFQVAMKDFARVYLKDVPNPTEAQIDEVVKMLENGAPKKGREITRARRKEIEAVIDKRKEEIRARFNEKEKEAFEIYSAPEPDVLKPEYVKPARDYYEGLINAEKDKAFSKENVSLTREEAEERIREQCDNSIEDLIDKTIRFRTKDLAPSMGLKRYYVKSENRTLRYDRWLKKEIEKLDHYEKNNGIVDLKKVDELDEKLKSELESIDKQIVENEKQRKNDVSKINKLMLFTKPKQKEADLKAIDDNLAASINANNEKIEEINEKIKDNAEQILVAGKLKRPAKHFDLATLKDALDKCNDAPNLDMQSVMEATRSAARSLLKQNEAFAKGHTNSIEFNNMMIELSYVTNWGTDLDTAKNVPGAPKTYDEALDRLKESCRVYVEEKDKQRRPFPSKLRYFRYEFAGAIEALADLTKENLKDISMTEKEADSWNKYFATRGRSPIVKEQSKEQSIDHSKDQFTEASKETVKEEKQVEEPVLEDDDIDFAFN